MKKYTKEQNEAIEYLVKDIDELNNKPRRLFSSLRKIANAFLDKKGNKMSEHLRRVLLNIDIWEEDFYKNYAHIRGYEIPYILNEIRTEEISLKNNNRYGDTDEEKRYYNRGVEDAMIIVRIIIANRMLVDEFDFQGYVDDKVNERVEGRLASGRYKEVKKK